MSGGIADTQVDEIEAVQKDIIEHADTQVVTEARTVATAPAAAVTRMMVRPATQS